MCESAERPDGALNMRGGKGRGRSCKAGGG